MTKTLVRSPYDLALEAWQDADEELEAAAVALQAAEEDAVLAKARWMAAQVYERRTQKALDAAEGLT